MWRTTQFIYCLFYFSVHFISKDPNEENYSPAQGTLAPVSSIQHDLMDLSGMQTQSLAKLTSTEEI